MITKLQPTTLRHLLAYDTYVAKKLSVWQRMKVHQAIAGHSTLGVKLTQVLTELYGQAQHWEAPTVRYNALRELETQDEETGNWKLLNNNK